MLLKKHRLLQKHRRPSSILGRFSQKLRKLTPDPSTILGVGRATVPRLRADFGAGSSGTPAPRKAWGGRRHALLAPDQEQAFVSKWRAKAEAGELVVLSAVRADLEKQLDRKVAAEVFYRLMHRHRWRKVAPDTRHPKGDPTKQEEWRTKPCRKTSA